MAVVMPQSLSASRPPHKGRFAPQFCPPGPALWHWLEQLARSERLPVFRAAGGLRVPALIHTHAWRRYDREPATCGIRAAVAAHLESERDGAKRVGESRHARVQLARLSAAAFRDLGGNALADIVKHGDYEKTVEPNSALRTLRRDIAEGRRLWAAVGAWPWQPLGAGGGALPRQWWELDQAVEALAVWRSGRHRLP